MGSIHGLPAAASDYCQQRVDQLVVADPELDQLDRLVEWMPVESFVVQLHHR